MENQKKNDLFFVASLIEYIARNTKNTKKYITEKIGMAKLQKIYDLAEVYHSLSIEQVKDELIEECHIETGNYDILVKTNNQNPPSYWDMGMIDKRLAISISNEESEYLTKLYEVLTSWLIPHFDNYDSSLYFENPSYIEACYKEGKILP